MADDPLKSPNDGALTLPPTDLAMNKRAPIRKKGGKGSENDGKNTRLGGKRTEDEELLDKARKRLERAISAEADNRREALEDLKFFVGDQWPADIKAQRKTDNRPCLTVNKIPTFVHQITNDLRQNRPGIAINPTGDKTDPEVAKMYGGMVRAIQRDCHADLAYDTGVDLAVKIGWGYWRVTTDFEGPDTFDQVIKIERIRNPFTVYLDPDAQEPDGRDAQWGFITTVLTKDEYKEKYPKSDIISFTQAGIGDKLSNWVMTEGIRVAEYFKVSKESRKLVALSNGFSGWQDELDESIQDQIKDGSLEVVRERDAEDTKIKWYEINGHEVLSEKEWVGKEGIPIVRVVGEESDVEGKLKLAGIIRHAKDPQRMFNYWRTLETEVIALQPKAPWVMEEGQVEGYESMWKSANTASLPYLLYKGSDVGGKPAPPPQRQPFAGAPQGVETAVQGAAQDMMAATGIRFDATQNERMIDESGKAIRELRRSGDLGSFHYADNLGQSLRRTGHILIDLIPRIYDRRRMVTILREDDSEEQIIIDPDANKPMQEVQGRAKRIKVFNPKLGTYGVTVTIGPSYATKRIESSERMMEFAKAMPQTASLIADLIAKNQDWEGADEMARRLAKAVPPQLMTPDVKDIPPQVQAVLQNQQQQIQQMTQALQALQKQLQEKQTGFRSEEHTSEL